MRVMMTVIAFLYQPFAGGYGYTGNLAREASVAAAFNNDGKGFDVVINCVGPRVPVSILSMVKSKWRTSHLMAYSPHASHSAHTLRLPGVPINYYAAPIPIALNQPIALLSDDHYSERWTPLLALLLALLALLLDLLTLSVTDADNVKPGCSDKVREQETPSYRESARGH